MSVWLLIFSSYIFFMLKCSTWYFHDKPVCPDTVLDKFEECCLFEMDKLMPGSWSLPSFSTPHPVSWPPLEINFSSYNFICAVPSTKQLIFQCMVWENHQNPVIPQNVISPLIDVFHGHWYAPDLSIHKTQLILHFNDLANISTYQIPYQQLTWTYPNSPIVFPNQLHTSKQIASQLHTAPLSFTMPVHMILCAFQLHPTLYHAIPNHFWPVIQLF